MATWDEVLTERDKEIFKRGGFGKKKREFGNKPALVVVDVTYGFVGDKPEPILKSIERFPLSCGEEGWKAVYQIASLLPLAREKKIPIIYSKGQPTPPQVHRWSGRIQQSTKAAARKKQYEFVKEIAPTGEDIIITKLAPSVFFDTPIMSILVPLKVDTLLFCGGVTSGCLRASVVDAASYVFNVGVIEECIFDRFETSHKISLFDMNAKYAQVISITEVKDYFSKLEVEDK